MMLLYIALVSLALSCDLTCSTCSGGTANDCLTCYTHAAVASPSGPCVCSPAYYPNPDASICAPCHSYCPTCSGPATSNCLTCPAHAAVSPSPGTCLCSDTYYPNPNVLTCAPCHASCLTCNGPAATQCTGCASGATFNAGAKTCSCSVGYLATPDARHCLPVCDSTCQACSAPGPTFCTSCFSNASVVGGACVCDVSTFPSPTSRVCAGCHATCSICSGVLSTQCTGCLANAVLTGLSTCECVSPFVPSPDARFCSSCDLSCLTCSLAGPSGCLSCKPFAELIGLSPNSCACGSGYFMNPPKMDCELCSSTCYQCSGLTTSQCQSCFTNAVLVGGIGPSSCTCDARYYPLPNVNNCMPCSPLCENCVDNLSTHCTTCNSNASLQGTAPNSCKCNNGYFPDPDPQKCTSCYTSCLTCESAGSSNCLSCYPNAELRTTPPGSCFCKQSFMPSPSEANCVTLNFCHAHCATCATPYQDGCLSCKGHAVLQGNGPARCSCFVGFYGSPDACLLCDPACASCIASGPLACTGCKQKASLAGGSPAVCLCNQGAYPSPDASNCKACPYQCKICTSIACIECWDGYYLNATGSCLGCESSCSLCRNETSCLSCRPGLYLNISNQCQECSNCREPLFPNVTSPYDHKYKIEFNRAVLKNFNDADFLVETDPISAVNWTVVHGSELLLQIIGGPWSNNTVFILVFTHVNEIRDRFNNTLAVSEVYLSPPFLSTTLPSTQPPPVPPSSATSAPAGPTLDMLAPYFVASALVLAVALAAGAAALAVPLLSHFAFCSYLGTIGAPAYVSNWLKAMNVSGFMRKLISEERGRRLSGDLLAGNGSFFQATALPLLLFLCFLLFHCTIRILICFKPNNSLLNRGKRLFEWTIYLHFCGVFCLDLTVASLMALIEGSVYVNSMYIWEATMTAAACLLVIGLFTLSIAILTYKNRENLAFNTQYYSFSAVVRHLRRDKTTVAFFYTVNQVHKLLYACAIVVFRGNSLGQALCFTMLATGVFIYSITVQPYGRPLLRWLHVIAELDTLLAYLLMVIVAVTQGIAQEQMAWVAFALLLKAAFCLFLMPVAVLIMGYSRRLKSQAIPVIIINEDRIKSMRAWQFCTPTDDFNTDFGGTMIETVKWQSPAQSPDLLSRPHQHLTTPELVLTKASKA